MTDGPIDVMRLDELADYLKVSKSTLYKLAQRGSFPCRRSGSSGAFITALLTIGSGSTRNTFARKAIRSEQLWRKGQLHLVGGGPVARTLPPEPVQERHVAPDGPAPARLRLGTDQGEGVVLPKLRSGSELKIGIEFSVTVETGVAQSFQTDLKQILDDLGLTGRVRVEPTGGMTA